MTIQLFGAFHEPDESLAHMTITFDTTAVYTKTTTPNKPSITLFENYWGMFVPGNPESCTDAHTELCQTIHFIANELLENLIKHADQRSPSLAHLSLFVLPDTICFYATNTAHPDVAERYHGFITQLLTEDSHELYVEQTEQNARDSSNAVSRIGLLTMVNDYQANLAWKFEANDATSSVRITTMVQLSTC